MRAEKQLLLDEIKEKIDASKAMIITSYEKLEPNAAWKFREALAQSGGVLEVVRKRVFLKAAEQAGLDLNTIDLPGHIGVVFVNQPDAIASAKTIFSFSEENGEVLQVLCGKVEGEMLPGSDVKQLAKLPGLNEMRANMLGLFEAPMSQFLAVLEAVMAGPLSVIEQKLK